MQTYLAIANIILSVALIAVTLMQVKGGGLGGIFGQSNQVFRSKRGMDKILFYVTIVLAVLFVAVSILILRLT